MAMHLRTRTDYDLARLEELQRVAGKTFGRGKTIRKRGLSLVLGAVCLWLGLAQACRKDSVVMALLSCIIGSVLLLFCVFFYTISAWMAERSMGNKWKNNEFVLEKDAILAINGTESFRYPYTACVDLLESEENLYFVMDSGQGLLLDKANVQGGSVDDMRAWLEEKCQKKLTWVGRKA